MLAQARRLKADGVRHAHLRGPLALPSASAPSTPDGAAPIAVTVVDGAGRAVAGLPVSLEASAGSTLAQRTVTTGADGTARTFARPVRLPLTVRASALAPRLGLDAWAPTTRPAQRVARPSVAALRRQRLLAARHRPPPRPRFRPPRPRHDPAHDHDHRADRPPRRHSRRRRPFPRVAAPTTSTSTSPPETVLNAPPTVPALPRTGVDVVALAMLGAGLLLLGAARARAPPTAHHALARARRPRGARRSGRRCSRAPRAGSRRCARRRRAPWWAAGAPRRRP